MLLLMAISLLVVLLPYLSSANWSQDSAQEKPAECRTYAVRRIEVTGNESTRDNIIRRRIVLSGGKTLTERDIEQTLKNLNRLKRIEKLKREDIEITYAVKAPVTPDWYCFADVLIHVKEKKRR
jgi:outer membrane protein assembly factor BamA